MAYDMLADLKTKDQQKLAQFQSERNGFVDENMFDSKPASFDNIKEEEPALDNTDFEKVQSNPLEAVQSSAEGDFDSSQGGIATPVDAAKGMESFAKSIIQNMPNATELEHTELYEAYFKNGQDRVNEHRRIANALGIDPRMMEGNREAYIRLAKAAEEVEKYKQYKEFLNADGTVNMQKIYDTIPGLAKIQKEKGVEAAALALGNINGVKQINEIYDTEFGKVVGSIQAGWDRNNLNNEKNQIYAKAAREMRYLTKDEENQVADINNKLNKVAGFSYSSTGGVLGAMLGGVAENAEMFVDQLAGTAAGALAAGATMWSGVGSFSAGAAYKVTSNLVSTALMANQIMGGQYEELLNKRDAQGKLMYTPQQAATLAGAQGISEAILEQWTFSQMGRAIMGKPAEVAIKDIITKSAMKQESELATKASIGAVVKERLKDAWLNNNLNAVGIKEASSAFIAGAAAGAKAGLASGMGELKEEFLQQASDMVLEDVWQAYLKGDKAEIAGLEDILASSTANAIMAIPTVAGFGILGFSGNRAFNNKYAQAGMNRALGLVGMHQTTLAEYENSRMVRAGVENAHRFNIIANVNEAISKGALKDLEGINKDVADIILDEKNSEVGAEYTYVDFKALNQMDGGAELVNRIAEANGMTVDDVRNATALGQGMVAVKTSSLQLMQLDSNAMEKLKDNIASADEGETNNRIKDGVKRVREAMARVRKFSQSGQVDEDIVNNVVKDSFSDTMEQDIAKELFNDHNMSLKEYTESLNTMLDDVPVIAQLINVLKNDSEKSLSDKEIRKTAYDALMGNDADNLLDKAGLADIPSEELENARAAAKQVWDRLDKLNDKEFTDKVKNLTREAVMATADLSPEARAEYLRIAKQFKDSTNKDVSRAGEVSTILYLHMADRLVQYFKDAGKELTVKDALNALNVNVNATVAEDGGLNQLIGEQGAARLDAAEELTTRIDNLNIAREMEKAHKNAKTIKLATGWERGVDGKWRYEIDDSKILLSLNGDIPFIDNPKYQKMQEVDAKIMGLIMEGKTPNQELLDESKSLHEIFGHDTNELYDKINNGESFFLSDILKHDELFKAYPFLRNMRVQFKNLNELQYNGYFLEGKGITLNEDLKDFKSNIADTLLHEIQHAIQVAEGFAQGSNPSAVRGQINSILFDVDAGLYFAQEELKTINNELDVAYYVKANRRNLKNPAAIIKSGWFTEHGPGIFGLPKNKKAREEELIKLVEQFRDEGREKFKTQKELLDQLTSLDDKELDKEIRSLVSKQRRLYTKVAPAVRAHFIEGDIKKLSDIEIYRRIAGEVEARNVSARKDMSMEERLNSLASETEDVDRKDQYALNVLADRLKNPNALYQQANQMKGQISYSGNAQEGYGNMMISLFENADESTFLHEMSHAYLLELEHLASLAPESRAAKDLEVIKGWASWSKGQAEEYRGTNSEAEFYRLEQDILKAEKDGSITRKDGTVETLDDLKNRWMQERFARGFEEYLRSGEAPSPALKKPFRRLKQWLTKIYKVVVNGKVVSEGAGARASAEVEAVMARMVASDEMIETMHAMNVLDGTELDGDMTTEEVKAMHERWKEEAKEQAKEKMLAKLLAAYKKEVTDKLDAFRAERNAALTEELKQEPCFAVDATVEMGTPLDVALEMFGYDSEEKYKADKQKYDNLSITDAIKSRVEQEVEEQKKKMPTTQELQERAMEVMASEKQGELIALEAELLKRREEKYNEAGGKLGVAFEEVDKAISQGDINALERKIKELRYSQRWKEAELKFFAEMEKALLREEVDSAKEKAKDLEEEFKNKIKTLKEEYDNKIKELKYNERWKEAEAKHFAEEDKALLKEKLDAAKEKAKTLEEEYKKKIKALEEEHEQQIKDLKATERWKEAENKYFAEKDKAIFSEKLAKEKAKISEVKTMFDSFKKETLQNEEWMRGVRDAATAQRRSVAIAARNDIMNMPVRMARSVVSWNRQENAAANEAVRNITKGAALARQGKMEESKQAYDVAHDNKVEQLYDSEMVRQAVKVERRINQILRKVRDRKRALTKRKMPALNRYYYEHLLYLYGLQSTDAIPPSDLTDFNKFWTELQNSAEVDIDEKVDPSLVAIIDGTEKQMDYTHLTMHQLNELMTITNILYTTGINANRLLSVDIDIETVAQEANQDWMNNVAVTVTNNKIADIKGAMGKYMSSIMKPEVLLRLTGGKQGAFIKYIYEILRKATENEALACEREAQEIKQIVDNFYTREELKQFSKAVPGVTLSNGEELTKNNILSMALNWGNKTNQARLIVGLDLSPNEAKVREEIETIFTSTLTRKDWEFVQAVWNHINRYGDEVNKVVEKIKGVPMTRVEADAFNIKVAEDDGTYKTIILAGGYYPIASDPKHNANADEKQELENRAGVMGGNAALGSGLGSTKNRSASLQVKSMLLLDLGVISKHINQQIHIANMQLACRDAYKVLNNQTVANAIQQTWGNDVYRDLKKWVTEIWTPSVGTGVAEHLVTKLRSNTISAIMSYRVSTALLNFANISPMIGKIGWANTMKAMIHYAGHWNEVRNFVLTDSVWMRNRATNMDRDLSQVQSDLFNPASPLKRTVDKYSNWLIEQTDMLCSVPLYHHVYMETYNKLIETVDEQQAREQAHEDAHEAVRSIFGSADTVDTSKIQRSKNEFDKLLTPFFSFANTMFNAVAEKYYSAKVSGSRNIKENADGSVDVVMDRGDLKKKYAEFLQKAFYHYILMTAIETALRAGVDALTDGGDDKEPEELIYGFLGDWSKNAVNSMAGGFYGFNMFVETLMSVLAGEKQFGRGGSMGVIGGTASRIENLVKAVPKLLEGKQDAIDFGRNISKVGTSITGFSDTIVDAAWNTARFISDDYAFDDMDAWREYLAKSVFDRKLKAKK